MVYSISFFFGAWLLLEPRSPFCLYSNFISIFSVFAEIRPIVIISDIILLSNIRSSRTSSPRTRREVKMKTKRLVVFLLIVPLLVSCVQEGLDIQEQAELSATVTLVSTNTSVPVSTATLAPTSTQTPLPTATCTPVPTVTPTPLPTATPTPPYDWEGSQGLNDNFYMEFERGVAPADHLLELRAGYTNVMVIFGLDSFMVNESSEIVVNGITVLKLYPYSDDYGTAELAVISDGSAEVIVKNVAVPFFYYLPKTVGSRYFEERHAFVSLDFPAALHSVYVIMVCNGEGFFFGKLYAGDEEMLTWDGTLAVTQ